MKILNDILYTYIYTIFVFVCSCIRVTNSVLCVIHSTVWPCLLRSISIFHIVLAVSKSRLPVGSSASSIAGLWATALHIATLCFSPPLNSWGDFLSFEVSHSWSISWLRYALSWWGCMLIFCSTVCRSINLKSWKITPILALSFCNFFPDILVTSSHWYEIVPFGAHNCHISNLINEVLPLPLFHNKKQKSPSRRSKLKSWNIGFADVYHQVRLLIWIMYIIVYWSILFVLLYYIYISSIYQKNIPRDVLWDWLIKILSLFSFSSICSTKLFTVIIIITRG